MADIIAFDTTASDEGAPRRLKNLSRALALLFTLFLILVIAVLLAGAVALLIFPQYLQTNSSSAGIFIGPHGGPGPLHPGMTTRVSDQPLITHLAGLADLAIGLTPLFLIFWHLRGLFRLYAAGTVFAQKNAVHLKHVGLWLVAYPFAQFISNLVFRLAGGTDHNWLHAEEIDALVLGLIVLAIAQVMEFGREIEQEKDSFI
jgi:hypothetical protein